jgi:electron transfer flavoprotein beta subunit
MPYQIIVCGGLAPDPLQTLEPATGPAGPALKNETMLPHVFDPFAAHALYEAAHLAKHHPGSTIRVVSIAPRAKLQQVMMTVAQKLPFELVPIDAPAGGFTDAAETAKLLAAAIREIPGLAMDRLLLFGGCESATRAAGAVMQMAAAHLGIEDCFLAVDELIVEPSGALAVKERIEGGRHQVSRCAGPPAAFGWATGNLPEPPNHPQTGMANMRAMMPALQKAKPAQLQAAPEFHGVALPQQQRPTRIVKDTPAAAIAQEIAAWIKS